ncbi:MULTISPECIES: HAD-IA family hydrolase [unclassified Novosphingobium]|uniref:HAD-IA family hydrolase n=1 Tax=unclassified Novosphingobium TaxID=2644732 RepID=UPI00146BBA8E|nr:MULTISPECIES: HAD-IA family hydrolase [unclassified Novosphingobium]NMN04953.1 sugar-phosphatase [Novosphingobium sp. SG919]NMN87246.1 sugar-phosphatase [Novosphingobium sp. SG916]
MTSEAEIHSIDAVLLDMDGTILNSIATAERIWGRWAAGQGLDVDAFLKTIHGVQSVETIRRLGLPGVDPVTEAARITQAEIDDVHGIEAIAGSAAFLSSLPGAQWAVVTSAPRALAQRRIAAAGLPNPPILVAAEDVEHGKPAPDCFQLAARQLGTTAQRCLVLEDSAAGILAAERAGALVLVITATHTHTVETPHPAIRDYSALQVEAADDGELWIRPDGASQSYRLRTG